MAGKFTHFVAKITPDGGPNPAEELRNLIHQAETNPDGLAWFASPFKARSFDCSGTSICIIFHHPHGDARVEAVIARVLNPMHFGLPGNFSEVRKFYEDWSDRLNNWWPLAGKPKDASKPDIILREFDSLEAIPGVSHTRGFTAARTFGSQASLAGWDFQVENKNTLKWIREQCLVSSGDKVVVADAGQPSQLI